MPRALIAEDEPAQAAALRRLLGRVWPGLSVAAVAPDGPQALQALRDRQPDVAFLDIRLPGLLGTEVAEALPDGCRLVFVTAHADYAVEAFERAAVDYLLKPVSAERLAKTRDRLEAAWQAGAAPPAAAPALAAAGGYLEWLRASMGDRVELIPAESVSYCQARQKYTAVVTPHKEVAIRTPIKDLAGRLDPQRFRQIHRASIVNLAAIDHARRLPGGRLRLQLTDPPETLTVSRAYAGDFRGF